MEVGARTRGNGEPGSDVDVILNEHARSRVPVGKTANFAGKIDLPLGGAANHPRIAAKDAARGELAKKQLVPIAFADLPEAVIVVL